VLAVPVPPCFFQSVLLFFVVGNFFLMVVRKVVLAVDLVVGGGLGEVLYIGLPVTGLTAKCLGPWVVRITVPSVRSSSSDPSSCCVSPSRLQDGVS
jgi:hypothetical protein